MAKLHLKAAEGGEGVGVLKTVVEGVTAEGKSHDMLAINDSDAERAIVNEEVAAGDSSGREESGSGSGRGRASDEGRRSARVVG